MSTNNQPAPQTTGTRLVIVPPPASAPLAAARASVSPSVSRDRASDSLEGSGPGLRRELLRLSPGQVIPGTSWRITRWLGEGNMGVVYEARHTEIDRRAAIKIVVASLADDPAAVEDFRREASVSATIGSPNIIDVFDFAVLKDGRLMMAMEFVAGRSLHDLLVAEGPMAPSRLIGLFRQVCKGLQAAHDAGLVHRDIKPENIMVGDVGGRRDTVKLVDFGIATMLGQRAVRLLGTPYYMPPEGLMHDEIDGRYDIYSVGCVMFELLTGKPPYRHRDLERVLEMHLTEPVPELATSGPAVPSKLAEVVQTCLAKSPSERYASMAELEAALCEAQVDSKLRTTWDDLPLPDIDPERRARLLAKMPDRVVKRGVSAWWIPILLAAGTAAGAVIALPMLAADPPSIPAASETSEIDRLVGRIHAAGAQAYYVYPPVEDPQADTAYKLLKQLESLGTLEASTQADALRAELASTLVRLGDDIWDKEGGEPFALDFYVQAIIFDPRIEPARSRAALSPGELLALRRKAETGEFSQSELIAVEPLQALAETDASEKQTKLVNIQARRKNHRSARASAQIDALIAASGGGPGAVEPTSAGPAGGSEPPDAPADGVVGTQPEGPIGALAAGNDGLTAQGGGSAAGESDHKVARKAEVDALIVEADAARKATRLAEAEKLYHKALRLEKRRLEALVGLGRVYFEQANYAKAVKYYEMAVHQASGDAELRIALGDAYLKTLAYDDAIAAYKQAKQRGSSKADARIARVEARTGG